MGDGGEDSFRQPVAGGELATIPLCRIGYLGFHDVWEFAIYDPATDTYQDSLLPSGTTIGTVQEALCAAAIHLTDTTD